jgi:hypothetical protein
LNSCDYGLSAVRHQAYLRSQTGSANAKLQILRTFLRVRASQKRRKFEGCCRAGNISAPECILQGYILLFVGGR